VVYFLAIFFVFAQTPPSPLLEIINQEKAKPGIPIPAVPVDYLSKSFNLFNQTSLSDVKKIIEIITIPSLRFRNPLKSVGVSAIKEPSLDLLINKVTKSGQTIAILLFRNPFAFLFPFQREAKSYVLISRIPRELVLYFSGIRVACLDENKKERSVYFDSEYFHQLPINLSSADKYCSVTFNFFDPLAKEFSKDRSLIIPLKIPQTVIF
jgi:hypothetical protein